MASRLPTIRNLQALRDSLDSFKKNEKLLFKESGVNSVSIPPALSSAMYDINTSYKQIIVNVYHALIKWISENNILYAVLELQFLYGLRISEVLNISPSNITISGGIIIQGLKGSENRYIHPVYSAYMFSVCKRLSIFPFKGLTRHYVYREYKKMGIQLISGTDQKNSVTHALRYLFIKELVKDTNDMEFVKKTVGHKSISNTINYAKKRFK